MNRPGVVGDHHKDNASMKMKEVLSVQNFFRMNAELESLKYQIGLQTQTNQTLLFTNKSLEQALVR
jgi:hypothetical protein